MNRLILTTIIGATLSAQTASAEAVIGPKLTQQLLDGLSTSKVVVTTHDRQALDAVLQSLNIPYQALQSLPMAGATLTQAQIEQLQQDSRVSSIYLDSALEYYNYTSGEITGGHFVHDVDNVTGRGITIAVLDSGVDATHPDLPMGSKLVQNVKIAGDLDLAGGVNLFLEGVANSDTSSGHGTHVAGTVAGSGAASSDDSRRAYYHDGIAPDAQMVGIGAGDGISIFYALAGFDYAIANQQRYSIDVITNSWGGGDGNNFDPNHPINQASYQAYRQGIVVSFAASNSGPDNDTLNQYAIAPWVINVAAGTSDKQLANFSSRGVAGDDIKAPDITAPGSRIISTRAANTALPVLGPVVDEENPEYHLYYAGMSGTSMATPFIAGVAGLLLEVNPDLSPDQIEDIIKSTAEPMPDYAFHEVGHGYVDVKSAIALARNVTGQRTSFLQGLTQWLPQGQWFETSEADSNIDYISRWRMKHNSVSTDGQYMESRRKKAALTFDFIGDSIQLLYLTKPKGGHAEVLIDGESVGIIDYFGQQVETKSFVVRDLDAKSVHTLELRKINGRINLDGVKLSGSLVDNGTEILTDTTSFSGTIGVSAENLEVQDHLIAVNDAVIQVDADLSWQTTADLDFEVLDPNGDVVASSATLDNPESVSITPNMTGDYTLRVKGYASVNTPYTIDVETTSMTQQ